MSRDLEANYTDGNIQDKFQLNEWSKAIFSATQCGIILIEKETHKIIDINPYALDIYELQYNEVINAPCAKFSCPSKDNICMLQGSEQIVNGEEREIRSNSNRIKTILISVSEFSIFGKEYIIENITDISDRKRYENEISEQKDFLQTLLNSISAPIYYKDINSLFLSCNSAFENLFSVRREQIIGSDLMYLWSDEVAQKLFENDRLIIEGKVANNIQEAQCNLPNGEIHDLLVKKSVFKKSDGSLGGIIGFISDITEIKQLERSLKEQSDFLSSMIDSIPNPILYTNMDGQYLGCNKAFEVYYGLTREFVIGKTIFEILPKELAEKYSEEDQKILNGEHSLDIYEREEKSASGGIRQYMIHKAPYFDEQRQIAGLITSMVDISDRKKIENDLRESEERYRLLAENSADVIWMLDKDLNATYVSPSVSKLRGTSVAESKRQHISEIMPKASFDIICERIANSKRNSEERKYENSTFEIEIYKIDGSSIWVEIAPKALYDKNGDFIAYLGVSREITRRKKDEEEINKLLTAIKQSPASVIITDTHGNIEYVNPKFTEVTGYTYEEAIGNNPRILKSESIPSEEYKQMWKLISSGVEWHGEFLNKRKNGELYWENASISAVTSKKGEISHYIAVKEDITDRKLKEQRIDSLLVQVMETNHIIEANLEKNTALIEDLNATKSQLETTVRGKDKFISILSHDLKNPFVTLLNMSELLLDKYESIDDEDKKSIIRNINKSSKNTYELLENLLEWSRAQMGGIALIPEKLDLSALFESALKVLKAQAVAKNIKMENQIPENSIVNCDKNMILTVIRNLISNAIKFTNLNGNVIISSAIADDDILVKIEDNGIGIPRIILDNLFKTNEKISRKGTSGEASTGLGLLLCKEYIEKHNGKIWATSEEGKGSSFYFSLPLGAR